MYPYLIVLTALLSFTQPALANEAALPDSVNKALKFAGIPNTASSVFVQRVNAKNPLIEHQADKPLNPASVMKLITTYAGLELLGPAYRWKTEVYTNGFINDGTLQGDLYIKGFGDPNLMAQDFWRLLGNLRQMGIKNIQGNLILDNAYFRPLSQDPGKFDGQKYRAYNNTASALLLNLNASSFRFSAESGEVDIRLEPNIPEITVVNNMKVSKHSCSNWRSRFKYDIKPNKKGVTITFNGKLGARCTEKYLDLRLFDNAQYAHLLFKKIWKQLDGTISGSLRHGTVPDDAQKLMIHGSKTLADVIRDVNKYSNNLIARQLFLSIAAKKTGLPATEAAAETEIKTWLYSKHLNLPEFSIENGSGLSRTGRITAKHLGELLIDAYHSPVMPELMSSMPILSVDGTVARRLKKSPMKGRAHLKTGSLNGVSSIAGYVLDSNNDYWVVVFMTNHAKAYASKKAQNALFQWIYNQP